jgi:hypothetical protein
MNSERDRRRSPRWGGCKKRERLRGQYARIHAQEKKEKKRDQPQVPPPHQAIVGRLPRHLSWPGGCQAMVPSRGCCLFFLFLFLFFRLFYCFLVVLRNSFLLCGGRVRHTSIAQCIITSSRCLSDLQYMLGMRLASLIPTWTPSSRPRVLDVDGRPAT